MKTIKQLVDNGEIRVGRPNYSTAYGETSEQIRATEAAEYAGAVVLSPGDPLPAEVGPRCWAHRLYTAGLCASERYDAETREIVYSDPPLWLVVWTLDAVEEAVRAERRAATVVDPVTFEALRSAGIEDAG